LGNGEVLGVDCGVELAQVGFLTQNGGIQSSDFVLQADYHLAKVLGVRRTSGAFPAGDSEDHDCDHDTDGDPA
jgi:hypothetical protein